MTALYLQTILAYKKGKHMKFAIEPHKNDPIINEVDELDLAFQYTPEDVIRYIEHHERQRIAIRINLTLFSTPQAFFQSEIWEKYSLYNEDFLILRNLYFILPFDTWRVWTKEEKMYFKQIMPFKWFFNQGCKTYGEIYEQLVAGAAQVLVYGEICFDIKNVARIIHDAGAEVRVMPDVAQASADVSYSGIRKFFIRPNGLNEYEDFIDTCVLSVANRDTAPAYYNIYKNDKEWYGDLCEIIVGLNEHLDNRRIPDNFDKIRMNCKQRCLTDGSCDYCGKVEELQETLSNAGLIIKEK